MNTFILMDSSHSPMHNYSSASYLLSNHLEGKMNWVVDVGDIFKL